MLIIIYSCDWPYTPNWEQDIKITLKSPTRVKKVTHMDSPTP